MKLSSAVQVFILKLWPKSIIIHLSSATWLSSFSKSSSYSSPYPSISCIFPCAPQVVYLSQGYPVGNTHFVTESRRFSRPLTLFIPCSNSWLFLSRSDAPLHVFPFTLPPLLHRLRLKRRLINTGIKFLSVNFPNKVTGRPSSLLYDHLVLL